MKKDKLEKRLKTDEQRYKCYDIDRVKEQMRVHMTPRGYYYYELSGYRPFWAIKADIDAISALRNLSRGFKRSPFVYAYMISTVEGFGDEFSVSYRPGEYLKITIEYGHSNKIQEDEDQTDEREAQGVT